MLAFGDNARMLYTPISGQVQDSITDSRFHHRFRKHGNMGKVLQISLTFDPDGNQFSIKL